MLLSILTNGERKELELLTNCFNSNPYYLQSMKSMFPHYTSLNSPRYTFTDQQQMQKRAKSTNYNVSSIFSLLHQTHN